jgi:hypothetical protein
MTIIMIMFAGPISIAVNEAFALGETKDKCGERGTYESCDEGGDAEFIFHGFAVGWSEICSFMRSQLLGVQNAKSCMRHAATSGRC